MADTSSSSACTCHTEFRVLIDAVVNQLHISAFPFQLLRCFNEALLLTSPAEWAELVSSVRLLRHERSQVTASFTWHCSHAHLLCLRLGF